MLLKQFRLKAFSNFTKKNKNLYLKFLSQLLETMIQKSDMQVLGFKMLKKINRIDLNK